MVAARQEYRAGDCVVYPGHGVGTVEAVVEKKIEGAVQELIRIAIQDSKSTVIFVPAHQAASVGLRKILHRRDLQGIYKILRSRDMSKNEGAWNRRHRDYLQKINTGSLAEIAEVIRDLWCLAARKELSFGQKRMLESAENLLIAEIALIQACAEDAVRHEIHNLVS
jgi:CarD family transcriptional regulator